ncbi:MAG: hypothetical protein OXI52_01165 [Caldilineaceae bacterium]|nr:hypothetical protein [Caldilineaceae bacterium]
MTEENGNRMNGSVDLLALAMRKVFEECMDSTREAVKEDIGAVREDMVNMESRLNDRIDTTNQNVQVQFAEQEKKIGKLLRKR